MSEPDARELRLAQAERMARHGDRQGSRIELIDLARADDALARRARRLLARQEEEDGAFAEARVHWQELLAEDLDDPEAQAQHRRLTARLVVPPCASAPDSLVSTLASPTGVPFHRYVLAHELGRGATATVYLGRDKALAREVAIKVLHAAGSSSQRSSRFFQEARLAAALRHPGVVAIYDLDEAAHVLVMEYLAGGTVRDWLGSGGKAMPPVTRTQSLAHGLLEVLAFVHGRGVVHGDLTPRNILLRASSQVALADFGNARLLQEETPLREEAGTPLYLAPEQVRGAAPSPATDLYAVGAILWESLAGRPMRSGADVRANRWEAPPLASVFPGRKSEMSRALVNLITQLTASQAERRPQDAGAARALLTG